MVRRFFLLLFFVPAALFAQDVPPVELSTLSPSTFAEDELDLPYYLAHFSRIANSVVMDGPERGFIDIPVWRSPERNIPDNPRIMENVLSLAFFYTTDRPWNPYFGHPAVRARLEAALVYWTDLQHDDGGFGRTEDGGSHLSPTAFATKFIGETLRLLESGPPIDQGILANVIAAQRQALIAVLSNRDAFYAHGRRFTNQYTNVWGGAMAYLDLYEDAEIERLLDEGFETTMADFQSPAGYFYEHGGSDWTHDIETHHSNHRMAWHYLRDTWMGDVYADHVRRWYNWLAYNAVLEPDGTGFAMNHSLETRLSFPFYRENRETAHGETCTPLAEVVDVARAFCESSEERTARLSQRRTNLERAWPQVAPLQVGTFDAYSPYAFLHRDHIQWHPTAEQKAAARDTLPSFAPSNFTHLRSDNREPMSVGFVRRAEYYAAFSVGEQLTPRQRYGLGLVWNPEGGAVLQSQSGSVEGAWGTRGSGNDNVYETAIIDPVFRINDEPVATDSRPRDFPRGLFTVSYSLDGRGEKTVAFHDREIVVTVRHAGEFIEHIPLLVVDRDEIDLGAARIRVAGERPMSIILDNGVTASLVETGVRSGSKRGVSVVLRTNDTLTYRLRFE